MSAQRLLNSWLECIFLTCVEREKLDIVIVFHSRAEGVGWFITFYWNMFVTHSKKNQVLPVLCGVFFLFFRYSFIQLRVLWTYVATVQTIVNEPAKQPATHMQTKQLCFERKWFEIWSLNSKCHLWIYIPELKKNYVSAKIRRIHVRYKQRTFE